MRRLLLLIAVVLFYVSCQQNNAPKGVIERGEMLNVMLDMQLSDAALNQVYNNDTMKMQARSRYSYVFAKYKIDSTAFTNSLKYYSKDPSDLDFMYTQVSDSLTRLQEILRPKHDSLKMQKRTLYGYILKNLKIDSSKVINNLNYYTLDAKKLYAKYTRSSDSLKRLQDSIKKEQVEKIKNLKKATKIKHDLSTQ
ncbi:DUF4296 domain-containing protein [Pedobacter arcticus]|uniref:DUF4296 domain-containing protein n=1 Tax=Pedobacter arcticus TaxID=752140 RepID=UPI0002D6692E|nr:DUF4296 domain-containing protein [Pedobacter arcticus]